MSLRVVCLTLLLCLSMIFSSKTCPGYDDVSPCIDGFICCLCTKYPADHFKCDEKGTPLCHLATSTQTCADVASNHCLPNQKVNPDSGCEVTKEAVFLSFDTYVPIYAPIPKKVESFDPFTEFEY